MKFARKNGRIYVEETPDPTTWWSMTDPDHYGPTSAQSLANDLHYLLVMCPDTKTAQRKLALVRRAIREVKRT